MTSFRSTCLGWLLLVASSNNSLALTPDGGKWFHPGSPFTVSHQTPTRHVGKEGTRLQSDPYGMPSYGRLDDDAFVPVRDDPSMAVMDFGRPPDYHRREPYRPEPPRRTSAAAAAATSRPFASSSSSSVPVEPPIREYERQEYFRPRREAMSHSFSNYHNRHNPPPYQPQRPGDGGGGGMGIPSYGQEEDYFFAGHPSFGQGLGGWEDEGIPSFFQRPTTSSPPPPPPSSRPPTPPSFSFAGRPSTSFHQRPLQPNFY